MEGMLFYWIGSLSQSGWTAVRNNSPGLKFDEKKPSPKVNVHCVYETGFQRERGKGAVDISPLSNAKRITKTSMLAVAVSKEFSERERERETRKGAGLTI